MSSKIMLAPGSVLSNTLPDVESVLELVVSLWKMVDTAPDPVRVELKKDIVDTVNRLRRKVETRLERSVSAISSEKLLFDELADRQVTETETPTLSPAVRFFEPPLRVYAKDLADHALKHLPKIAHCHSIDELRTYLADNLCFNAQATRRRNANYLINRFFPGGFLNHDLPAFAVVVADTPALGEALFYLTCRTEKIVALVAEDVVFPSLAQGGISRSRIREFVRAQFPGSKSVEDMSQAIVRTYELYGLGTANRTRLEVSLREGGLASFAYVLHLEFSEPGMYSFERMIDGPMHRWLLWDQQWMIRQLYRLREAGLLSKVSEIDRMRQFTTKYSLADAVQPIVALAKESPV